MIGVWISRVSRSMCVAVYVVKAAGLPLHVCVVITTSQAAFCRDVPLNSSFVTQQLVYFLRQCAVYWILHGIRAVSSGNRGGSCAPLSSVVTSDRVGFPGCLSSAAPSAGRTQQETVGGRCSAATGAAPAHHVPAEPGKHDHRFIP